MEVSSWSSNLPVNVYFKIVHRVVDCLKYLIPFRKHFEQIVRAFSTQVHHELRPFAKRTQLSEITAFQQIAGA